MACLESRLLCTAGLLVSRMHQLWHGLYPRHPLPLQLHHILLLAYLEVCLINIPVSTSYGEYVYVATIMFVMLCCCTVTLGANAVAATLGACSIRTAFPGTLLQVQIGYKVGGYSNRPDIVIITTKCKSKSIYFDTKHIGYSDTRL